MKKLATTAMVLLTLSAVPLVAQEGPYVPCVACEEFTQVPYPEPGAWYNPDQSGSGFSLEFQNGTMGGYYFGYDTEGNPAWYLLAQPLVRSETPGVMWEVEVTPLRFSGGNCLGCDYIPPNDPVGLEPIKFEFLQRAYARVTLNDGSIQFMVPILYGEEGRAFFQEHTPYVFPLNAYDPYANLWNLVFRPKPEEEYDPWRWLTGIFKVSEGEIQTGGPLEGKLKYRIIQPVPPPESSVPFGDIICDLDEDAGEPICILTARGIDSDYPPEFRIPVGNLTDSRFFGETEDGMTVEGFRLQYD